MSDLKVEYDEGGPEEVNSPITAAENMFKKMTEMVQNNGSEAIFLWEWVTDMESFEQTVENMFHSNFLIKEDLIKIGFLKIYGRYETMVKPLDPEIEDNAMVSVRPESNQGNNYPPIFSVTK